MPDYHNQVLEIIERRGAQGVTELAKLLNVPSTSLQRWLGRQDFFVQMDNRKWNLPGAAVHGIFDKTETQFYGVLDSQINAVKATSELLFAQLDSVQTMMKAQKPKGSMAGLNMDKRFGELQAKIGDLTRSFKGYLPDAPEEFRELIAKMDLVGIALTKGTEYTNEVFIPSITSLLLGKTSLLDKEAVILLEKYQQE